MKIDLETGKNLKSFLQDFSFSDLADFSFHNAIINFPKGIIHFTL